MCRGLFVLLLLCFASTGRVSSHHESGEWSCETHSDTRVQAEFGPGIITLDGHADDWKDIHGFEFSLLPALDPHKEHEYQSGRMKVKALHDGKDLFFLVQIDGDYVYTKGDHSKCPSVALMFQIGENATYHDMGGCKEDTRSCTSKTCRGYEVDLMHFSIGNAIPGRLYGANPIDNARGYGGDSFGHLIDAYAWNPHCRFLDGTGPSGNDSSAQNNWRGAWWHSSFDVNSGFLDDDSPYAKGGEKGTYYFEFSRSLRTTDRLQQDAQFRIGGSSNMSVAFWYPIGGKPWHGSGHYSVGCDWVPLDISLGASKLSKSAPGSSWDAPSAFSLVFSLISLCVSVFLVYRVTLNKNLPFTPISSL